MYIDLIVAPFTGAWIEILKADTIATFRIVAPFTGAWIEIQVLSASMTANRVAPFTGAWIEISAVYRPPTDSLKSHPSRVRGLKLPIFRADYVKADGRTLHGCVD